MLNSLSNAKHLVHLAPFSWLLSVNRYKGYPPAKARLKSVSINDGYGLRYFNAGIQNLISLSHFAEPSDSYIVMNEKYGSSYKMLNTDWFGRNINPRAKQISDKISCYSFVEKYSSKYVIRLPRKLGYQHHKDILGGPRLWKGCFNNKTCIQEITDENRKLSCTIFFDTLEEAEQILLELQHPVSRMAFVCQAATGGTVIQMRKGPIPLYRGEDLSDDEHEYARQFVLGNIDYPYIHQGKEFIESDTQNRKQVISVERRAKTEEVFTSPWAVQKMINLIPKEVLLGTFMEPAAGEGNILLAVMKEKLKYQSAEEVARTCHAIEYMEDNHRMMVERAVQILGENNRTTIEQNIKQGDGTNFEWFHKARCPEPTRTLEDILVTL